jgi:hypothetical protein
MHLKIVERLMKKKKLSRESSPRLYSFEDSYPNIAAWVLDGGWVEIGYVEYTKSFVRALDEGGMVRESANKYASIEQALEALDKGIAEWVEEHG